MKNLGRTYTLWTEVDGKLRYVPGSAQININIDLFEDLEAATGKDRDYMLFITAVTILHELVHYGYNVNELTTDTKEEGNDFEKEVYGEVVKLNNYKRIMDKWQESRRSSSSSSIKLRFWIWISGSNSGSTTNKNSKKKRDADRESVSRSGGAH
jgi:hypothetical protein